MKCFNNGRLFNLKLDFSIPALIKKNHKIIIKSNHYMFFTIRNHKDHLLLYDFKNELQYLP
jgi:hypothetical protein